MHDGIRENTKRTYRSAQNDYIKFCEEYTLNPLPASQECLMMYATQLYKRHMHINTIKVYLFAVRHYHIINKCNNPLLCTPRLNLVLKAIQLKCIKSKSKLPITYPILEKVYVALGRSRDERLMWAAMTLGFFGLLRASEFTVPSQASFCNDKHLTVSDVSLRSSHSNDTFMSVRVKSSKTDSKGFILHIGCSQHTVCAVCAMTDYLNTRAMSGSDPLFLFDNDTILSRSILVSTTRSYLAMCGIDPEKYTGHSYRVGGATSAAEAGLSDWEIKAMGRWNSECYHRYIKASIIKVIGFASRMVIH